MQQRTGIDSWWWASPPAARQAALDLAPGEFLPERLALDLRRHGVAVADVAVCWDVGGVQRAVTVFVQPRVLTEFLAAERAWAGGWEDGVLTGS